MSSDESKATNEQPASDPPEPAEGPSSADRDASADESAPAVAPKASAGKRPKRAKKGKKGKRDTLGSGAEKAAGPGQKPGRLALWLTLLAVAAAVLGVGGYYLARRLSHPKWKVGSEVSVEITLVATDKAGLACAASDEVAGKRCAFEEPRKPATAAKGADDKALLKPYTTTDRRNLLAAGLWSEPALAGDLPSGRFSVKCSFVIEGMMKQLSVRWGTGGQWSPPVNDWFTGTVKSCTLVPATAPSATPAASSSVSR